MTDKYKLGFTFTCGTYNIDDYKSHSLFLVAQPFHFNIFDTS